MAVSHKECQNRLRRRVASGDLLPPLDLLIQRGFLVIVVAAIPLVRLSFFVSGEVHSMIASRSVIKAISSARSLPSRGPPVFVGPPWWRSRSGPPSTVVVVATRSRWRRRERFFSTTTAGASVVMTLRFSTARTRPSDGISIGHRKLSYRATLPSLRALSLPQLWRERKRAFQERENQIPGRVDLRGLGRTPVKQKRDGVVYVDERSGIYWSP